MKLFIGFIVAMAIALGAAGMGLVWLSDNCRDYKRPIEGQQAAKPNQQASSKSSDRIEDPLLRQINQNDVAKSEDQHQRKEGEWWDGFFCEVKATDVALAYFTLFLVFGTFALWWATSDIARDANQSSEMLVNMEAPYVTGGGDFESVGGRWFFRLDVENHGKTPAFMTGYDLQFATLAEVKKELKEVKENFRHMDGISAHGKRKIIRTERERCYGADMVYGAIFYQDVFKDRYCSRFLLRVAPWLDIPKEGLTRLDVDTGVSSKYWSWDRPKNKETKNAGLSEPR
jgi:hypothetical protein